MSKALRKGKILARGTFLCLIVDKVSNHIKGHFRGSLYSVFTRYLYASFNDALLSCFIRSFSPFYSILEELLMLIPAQNQFQVTALKKVKYI